MLSPVPVRSHATGLPYLYTLLTRGLVLAVAFSDDGETLVAAGEAVEVFQLHPASAKTPEGHMAATVVRLPNLANNELEDSDDEEPEGGDETGVVGGVDEENGAQEADGAGGCWGKLFVVGVLS